MALSRSPRHDSQKKTAHAEEQERPDVAERREAWFEGQPDLDPSQLVFIDETAATTKMARLRGWARRGERCRSAVPHGHWKTTTFVGALRLEGMTAPMVLDGPMTGQAFLAYVVQNLAPTLAAGNVVVMDNLAVHHVAGVREAIASALTGADPFSLIKADPADARLMVDEWGGATRGSGSRRSAALASFLVRRGPFLRPGLRI